MEGLGPPIKTSVSLGRGDAFLAEVKDGSCRYILFDGNLADSNVVFQAVEASDCQGLLNRRVYPLVVSVLEGHLVGNPPGDAMMETG